ncbi:MAG: hydantoinase/oxoprolinase family protein [Lentisphaerae bacterium]|nr:hydantoinase/oxoprolinase family protein [Lentisphaerota bacterium]
MNSPGIQAGSGSARLGIGIDAGGTYTDVVLYDFTSHRVLQKAKSLTTKWNYALGIDRALDRLDASRLREVDLVSVSTTLATNAVVEGRGQKVGLLLMPPYGFREPELFTHDIITFIAGKLEIDGQELAPVNPDEVRREVQSMVDRLGVQAFAVAGYASHANPLHELQVKAALRDVSDAAVTCSHEVSERLHYRIRAETAVLNARIIPCLDAFLADVETAIRNRGLRAPLMVVRSDGSLMSLAAARARPVETLLSGPAASVAGAGFLSGAADAVVVDIGGTTTDTATLRHGAVQTCHEGARVGQWQTHVESLDMRTMGLGGDSRLRWMQGELTIGPQRVAPLAWLAAEHPRTPEALAWVDTHLARFLHASGGMEILALTPHAHRALGSDAERRVVQRLAERPYSVDELVKAEGARVEHFLPLERLEEDYIVQRCALTPTDLLHACGRLALWDAAISTRVCAWFARLMHLELDAFVQHGLDMVVRTLAKEILMQRLAGRIPVARLETPGAQALLDEALAADGDGFRVRVALTTPIVGIGAPAALFLPAAAKLLQAEVMVPEHADVANAVGAITAMVRIHRRVVIAINDKGVYRLEGLPGTPLFDRIEDAQAHAVQELTALVAQLGREAGSLDARVDIQIHDRTAPRKDGGEHFIDRAVEALLCGQPDLVRLAG